MVMIGAIYVRVLLKMFYTYSSSALSSLPFGLEFHRA